MSVERTVKRIVRTTKDLAPEVIKVLSGAKTIEKVTQSQRVLIRIVGEIDLATLPVGATIIDDDYSWLDWEEVK